MPTQKIFKQRVRARMAKTGEAYTTARSQLLRKAAAAKPEAEPATDTTVPPTAEAVPEAVPAEVMGVSDESMVRATGRSHAEWFAILDAWGATEHTHTEIARWLSEAQGVPPWWTQSVTVAYERARGMRSRHEMRDGYSVSATKSLAAGVDRALEAFTDPDLRSRWLPDAQMEPVKTRAKLTARFAWPDPASRVTVVGVDKGEGRSSIGVTHDQIADRGKAERLKAYWRERLVALKSTVEGD